MLRESEEPVNPYQLGHQVKKAYSSKYCLAPAALQPGCEGKIISAHTVHKASQSAIARDSHVYAFIPSMDDLIKHNGVLPPKLTGIGVVSTFTGFCGRHDNDIFRPVEDALFLASQEQCFLLAYRALSREIFGKQAQLESLQIQKGVDKGRNPIDQMMIQMATAGMEEGVNAALADQAELKPEYDRILVERDFTNVRAYVIKIEAPPPIMCSGMFAPECCLNGTALQDLADLACVPDYLSISSFFDGEHGYIVLAWLEHDDVTCRIVAEQLDTIGDDDFASVLTRMLFEYIENLAIQPDWWEALDEGQRQALIERMANSANPMNERKPDCLVDDGIHVPSWGPSTRRWIP